MTGRVPGPPRTLVGLLCAALAACGDSPANPPDGGGPPGPDAAPGPDAGPRPDADEPAPSLGIQFLDPDFGPFSGGKLTTLRGSGFAPGMTVFFDGRMVEPLDLEFVDSRRINVYTPAGDPGPADVVVRLGDQTASLPAGYTYEAINLSPRKGSVAGGTFVTINGFGTSFSPGETVVTFDGAPMVEVSINNGQQLSGLTPPGAAGSADVKVITGGEVITANDGYEYFATGDPFLGGMAGGPIDGTVNVVVVDGYTGNGIDGAYVVIGDPLDSPYQGTCDDLGQITFSAPGLLGPITVTASAAGYESSAFVTYDSRDITIFLIPPPTPGMGPFPPGRQLGHIYGHVVFGDATGIGSPHWDLVPEPRTPTEVKRVYVTTTLPNIYSGGYGPSAPIDYEYDPEVDAWEFNLVSRPAALAVVAFAGLYDPARDPSGLGVTGFEPFAMGVARGILVGPGENVFDIDVIINIPLDAAIRVELDQPPALNTFPWPGPTHYELVPFLDFGGEGVVPMNKGDVPLVPEPEPIANVHLFPEGETAALLSSMAPLVGNIADTSYTFAAGGYSLNGGNPFSVRIVRGVTDITTPVVIADFLGTPRPTDPFPGQVASSHAIHFMAEPPSTGEATFNMHILQGADGTPYFRIFTRGDVFDHELPDLTAAGIPPIPANTDVAWFFYRITIPGLSFDQFNYGHLNSNFWSAYAADAYYVQFPPTIAP